jgi:adenylate cyclase class 2
MAHEIETKVLDIDAKTIKDKLVAAGAVKTQETRLTVDWYRIKGTKEGEDPWFLRIRSNTEGKHEVTWKARSEITGVARKHKEINFTVAEPEKLADLFEELGLEKYAHQEKDRITFTLKDWQFDLDQYPRMPAYLEIEGTSEENIQAALALLDLKNHPASSEGERTLIQNTYQLDWYDMRF